MCESRKKSGRGIEREGGKNNRMGKARLKGRDILEKGMVRERERDESFF